MLILNILVSLTLVLPIKGYDSHKICLISEKRGKHPYKSCNIHEITKSDSGSQRTLLYRLQDLIFKNVEFGVFCQNKDHGCVFIGFFFPGVILSTKWSQNFGRGCMERKLQVLVTFLSEQSIEGQLSRPFSSQSSDQIFRQIFCSTQLKGRITIPFDITCLHQPLGKDL